MYCVEELKTYLKGHWSFSRQIFQNTQKHKMLGEVRLFSAGRGMVYWEFGLFYREGYQGSFDQKYVLDFVLPSQKQAKVYRQEGAFFFTLDLSQGPQRVHHKCGDDVYQGSLTPERESFTCCWHILGPRKKTVIKTRFQKKRPTGFCQYGLKDRVI